MSRFGKIRFRKAVTAVLLFAVLLLISCGKAPAGSEGSSVAASEESLSASEAAGELSLIETPQPQTQEEDPDDFPTLSDMEESENAVGPDGLLVTPGVSEEEEQEEGQKEETAEESGEEVSEEPSYAASVTEDGEYSSKEEVAEYLHLYGHLPENYITKKEAESLGWVASKGNLWKVAPGKSIGGSRFGNYEGYLPERSGRKYYECDIDYEGGRRNAKRIVYSNDGLIFYTEDHYNTFEQLY